MKSVEKIHTFLADRFSFIQYPHIRQSIKNPKWDRHESNPIVEVDKNSDNARISLDGKLLILMGSLLVGIISLIPMLIGAIIIFAVISSFF